MSASPQLLVVEHDELQRHLLARYLTAQGFRASGCGGGTALRAALRRAPPDLLLLDMRLQDEDSVELIREVRAALPDLGILMLADAEAAPLRVGGLEAGADDCLVKPFDARELMARVRSVLRRLYAAQRLAVPAQVRVGRCLLDLDRRELLNGDVTEKLAGEEFALLRAFAANPHRPLEPEWLAKVTLPAAAPAAPSIASRVEALRRKVERDPTHPLAIRTVAGVGYMFVPEAGKCTGRLS